MQDKVLQGGCACGEVQYRIKSSPLFVHCCHCTSCQRESGSAFALNAMIETDQVELTSGKTEEVITPSESGKGQKFHRCPTCKVALWSHYAMAVGDKISFLRVGTMENPDLMPPDIHIFTRSKQGWVNLEGDIPVVSEYYRRKEYWPEECVKRFDALRD